MPFDDNGDYYTDRTETDSRIFAATPLVNKIMKKIVDLQDQLIQHAYGGNKLNDNDVLRYSAMVEVLKAVLQ